MLLISEMNVFIYLKLINGKDGKKHEISELSMNDLEEKMEDLVNIIKNLDLIKYKIKY